MKNVKKAAIISAVVLMISIIPAFALNDTNTTSAAQATNHTGNITGTHNQNTAGAAGQNCHKNCDGQNCGTCDGEHHNYQYGQNGAACTNNCTCNGEQHKYQYGQKQG